MRRYVKRVNREDNKPNDPTEFDKLKAEMRTDSFKRLTKKRAKYAKFKREKALLKRRMKDLHEKELLIQSEILSEYGNSLEASLPLSEQWFRKLYLNEVFDRQFQEDHFKDQFNKPVNSKYIPDISNLGYRYIIEVDGSIHDRADIKVKDWYKDHYFKKRGYVVIRIKAYDENSYKEGIAQLREHIRKMNELEAIRRK